MRIVLVLFLGLVCWPSGAQQAQKTQRVQKRAVAKDWPLLGCGQDLKALNLNIEAYQKKLVAAADPLPTARRIELYARESVYSESLTLLTPQVFWKDIISSRVTKRCHDRLKAFKKSLQTNDSKGTPVTLAAWNQCVRGIYRALPRQTQRINQCVKQGLNYIKSRQKPSAPAKK